MDEAGSEGAREGGSEGRWDAFMMKITYDHHPSSIGERLIQQGMNI